MRLLRSLAVPFCLLLILTGCSTLVPVPASPPVPAEAAEASWSRVLARFVDDRGEVDFPALARDRGDLDRYVRYVADTPLDSFRDEHVAFAHLINAYNALSMYNVIESGIPRTHAGFNKVTFFFTRRLVIGGRTMSLYAFENDVIRPIARQRRDPRVHFALNCSALSCPVLPRQPFEGPRLDAQLERVSIDFFARPQNFRIDEPGHTVWLSEILDFYPEDFVPVAADTLLAYVNRFAPTPAPPDFKVRFTPYDWTIANQKRAR